MANVLNTDKQIGVISALAEGSSIRSIERITGVHRDMRGRTIRTVPGNAVLHIPPVVSPVLAVRAAIIQEFRERGTEN